MSAVHIEGVSRSFSGRPVLRQVRAAAEPGKVVGLLGRNGEGKTTLLRILLDMLAADRGRVEVLGMMPDGSGAIRRHVGYVPERPAFHDFMSVAQVLDLRRRFFPHWNTDKAAGLCQRLGLDPAARVSSASKGTLGKLAWVCAAAHEPELFLLDEPTSGLDALVRDDLLSHLIEELHGKGKTFIIANHRMEELAGLLDEVWALSDGALSVHQAEALRTGARRVTGRLPRGGFLPAGLKARKVSQDGLLVELAAFDEDAVQEAARSGLEDVHVEPLAFEQSLKILLLGEGGAGHD
ncbi:MAG: ABC transporter ATP-binding protein [Elusimicrobia bacterium]|nr:ABC transporter ATP-binding protein [Elusimicrobiota bacterium]